MKNIPTQVEQTLELLRNGVPLKEIREKISSSSSIATGIQLYLQQASGEVLHLQAKINSLQDEQSKYTELVNNLRAEEVAKKKEVEKLEERSGALKKEIQERTEQQSGLNTQMEQYEKRLKDLGNRIKELTDKGYTEEIIFKLFGSDVEHGKEMLERVQTIEKYRTETIGSSGALLRVNNECKNASEEKRRLEDEIGRLRGLVVAETAKLTKVRDESRLLQSYIRIVSRLMLDYGIEEQDWYNIFCLMKRLGKRGMPKQTMDNMRVMIEKYHTLKRLDSEIDGRKRTLTQVNDELARAECQLKADIVAFGEQSHRVKELVSEVKTQLDITISGSKMSLSSLNASTIEELRRSSMAYRGEVEALKVQAVGSMATVKTAGQGGISAIVEECSRVLAEIKTQRAEIEMQHRTQLEEWGQVQVKAGKLAKEIGLANVFFAMRADTEALKLIGKQEVSSLLRRLIDWYRQQSWKVPPKATLGEVCESISMKYYERYTPFAFDQALTLCLNLLDRGVPS